MAEKIELVKCLICSKICDGVSAFTHFKVKGHNSWQILLPKEVVKMNLSEVEAWLPKQAGGE